ncbi:MAG: RES family NAD+ phosphorylase [Burkholderiaceae bacterium]
MLNIEDLAFRFFESPIEKLFKEIRSSAFLRIEASESIAESLKQHLNVAAQFCTSGWDSNHSILYRARKNNYGQWKQFARSEMGPPAAHMASAGRAQLAGVAVLYVADTAQTAIAEVRPEVAEYVTTATFRIKPEKRLKVLDLTRFSNDVYSLSSIERSSLINLARYAFSAPIHPDNPKKYYAHAYFVQMVRDLRYDGIGYESAVHQNGRCFAFFDADNFRCTRTSLHQVKSVSIAAEPVKFSSAEKTYIAEMDAKGRGIKKY